MNKQAAAIRQQAGGLRRNSSAALLLSVATAASGTSESEGADSVSRAGLPISRQASSAALFPSGGIAKQPAVLASRARRPSLLGLAPPLVPSLHALPENDAYLGPPKPHRRTSSFAMSSPTATRRGSLEREAGVNTTPLTAQAIFTDARLTEPEILDQNRELPVEVSRLSTSGSLEAASSSLQGPLPVVLVSALAQLRRPPPFSLLIHAFPGVSQQP